MTDGGGKTDGDIDATDEQRESAHKNVESDAETITTDVESLTAQIAQLEDNWRRTAADLDNVRKRSLRDAAVARADERARVTAALLPVLDNLDLALEHADADPDVIIDGVRSVRDQAVNVIAALGYERRDDTGAPFDPALHEAIAVVDDAAATPGTIVQVVRPGYGDADTQLRPASVVVASGGQ